MHRSDQDGVEHVHAGLYRRETCGARKEKEKQAMSTDIFTELIDLAGAEGIIPTQ